jgi:hypothetical protein
LRYMRVWAPALLALLCVSRGVLAHDEEIEAEAEDASEAQPPAICEGGAADSFGCWNVDLLARLPTPAHGRGSRRS